MAEYGETFEVQVAPRIAKDRKIDKSSRDMLCTYFDNPIMYKIKDVDDRSMYMCKLYCLLSRECRYIVTIVDKDPFQVKKPYRLNTQEFYCLQTRTLADNHSIPNHNYNSRIMGPWRAKIERIGTTDEACQYECAELGLNVDLLLNGEIPEKYQAQGTLHNALETFQTIITKNSDDIA